MGNALKLDDQSHNADSPAKHSAAAILHRPRPAIRAANSANLPPDPLHSHADLSRFVALGSCTNEELTQLMNNLTVGSL